MTQSSPSQPPHPSPHPSSERPPWPRFTGLPEVRAARPAVLGEPWPRWGWLPREQRTWTFAPSPTLTNDSPSDSPPPLSDEGPEVRAPAADLEPELVEVRRSTSTAVVPVRRGDTSLADMTLGEVAQAIKRAVPVAAVAGVATAAVMSLFRRR